MHPWQVGSAANGVILVAYLAISLTIFRALVRSGQLRSNRLALATAAIFFTCAVHHGAHAIHMLLPSFGIHDASALALRQAWTATPSAWDVVSAGVAVWYWSLRRSYGALLTGPTLFEDLKARQRRALEINDDIVQGLAVAKYALAAGDLRRAEGAVDGTLAASRKIISDLLGSDDTPMRLGPGELVRSRAASVPGVPDDVPAQRPAPTQRTGRPTAD